MESLDLDLVGAGCRLASNEPASTVCGLDLKKVGGDEDVL